MNLFFIEHLQASASVNLMQDKVLEPSQFD